MKLASLLATTAIASIVGISAIPSPSAVIAETIIIAAAPQEKIDQITAVKGKPESAVLMRKLYAKDLTPIGIQPGGAGMVVNLYSKKDDTTASLCTTFDVVVAIKKGKIAKFPPAEVK